MAVPKTIAGHRVKFIIWSDEYLDYADWADDIEADYPELDVHSQQQMMYEINATYLDDERSNLSIKLPEEIICIADLGLWDGRHYAFKRIKSGNIADCLESSADMNTWFVDNRGDLRCEAVHHDGRNQYLYRIWKPGVTETQKENFVKKLLAGKLMREHITRLTLRIGDKIANAYGIPFGAKPNAA